MVKDNRLTSSIILQKTNSSWKYSQYKRSQTEKRIRASMQLFSNRKRTRFSRHWNQEFNNYSETQPHYDVFRQRGVEMIARTYKRFPIVGRIQAAIFLFHSSICYSPSKKREDKRSSHLHKECYIADELSKIVR